MQPDLVVNVQSRKARKSLFSADKTPDPDSDTSHKQTIVEVIKMLVLKLPVEVIC